MTGADLQGMKRALLSAGIEIYRTQPDELHIAERVRLHIMDSGVRIVMANGDVPRVEVRFTARAQRSDWGSLDAEVLFDKVRAVAGALARSRGFDETDTRTSEALDPVDRAHVLDVWYEVTFAKRLPTIPEAVDEVRWALGVEKYVQP